MLQMQEGVPATTEGTEPAHDISLPYRPGRRSETPCSSFGGVFVFGDSTDSGCGSPENETANAHIQSGTSKTKSKAIASPLPNVSSFWRKFPDFTPDPTAPLQSEIRRLAHQKGWNSEKKSRYQAEAVVAEISFQHNDLSDLEQWQMLCKEVGIADELVSITQCKKVSNFPRKRAPLLFPSRREI
jgi:hypothetical protein